MIEYNNLYIKYTKSQTTLKNKEEEISQLKNKIKEFELKTKTDALKRKSNSVNKNNTIDKVDSSNNKLVINIL